MERAGTAVAEVVLERFPGRVAVVCGGGNNGGDGRVCARVLREPGREVTVVEGFGELGEPDVIVDALLGIGLQEAPREDVARMIERINAAGEAGRLRRRALRRQRLDGRGAGRRRPARRSRSRSGRRRSGSPSRPGASTPGRCRSRRSGSRLPSHEHALVPAIGARRGPAQDGATSTKYRAGLGARRRRLAAG